MMTKLRKIPIWLAVGAAVGFIGCGVILETLGKISQCLGDMIVDRAAGFSPKKPKLAGLESTMSGKS